MTGLANSPRVLVVDDDASHRRMLGLVLSNKGCEISYAEDGAIALEILNGGSDFDFILLDMRMPGLDGLSTLKEIHRRRHTAQVVIMTAYAEVRAAVETVKLGALDYLTKPIDVPELLNLMNQSSRSQDRKEQVSSESATAASANGRFGMIGQSDGMKSVYDLIERVAPAEATVLITGESGTGKELVAAAIHRNSARGDKTLMSVNCAALPEHLIESELFGHVRGAFTGAETNRPGRFESADGGTIFLDEIGDMPPSAQAKMLRVLQEGTFEPVGSNESRQVNVRVVAATNKDLTVEVKEGRFRQDLFYRLNIVSIHLPPLRERREDISVLAEHFVSRYGKRNRKKISKLSESFLACLRTHEWPGNVRELENAIERCVILARSEELTTELLPPNICGKEITQAIAPNGHAPDEGMKTISEVERELILRTLDAFNGNQSQTARQLGISRQTLINKLKQYRAD